MSTLVEPKWERAAKTKMGIYLTSVETTFIKKTVDFSSCNMLADLGSGGGKYSMLAFQEGVNVVSMDRDLPSLKWLKYRNPSSDVIRGDVLFLPLRNDLVDCVFLIEIFDYISESRALLQESYRILKKDGVLELSFGNRSSLKSKLKQLSGSIYMQDKHSYREVIQLLDETKFKIVKQEGYNWLILNRESNNRLIPTLAKLIKLFRLDRFLILSPWVMICVTKR